MKNTFPTVLLTGLLLFSFSNAFGQDYIRYHQRIGKAEQAILDSNYTDAVAIYDSVFKEYSFVFAENCYTATQTAVVEGNYSKAFQFLQRCFLQGLGLEIIDKDSILIQLKDQDQWPSVKTKFDSLNKIYKGNVDWELRIKIDSLNALDQKYRDKHETHPWNFLWRPFIWHKWKKVTRNIVENKLYQIIKEKGFPGERIIGVDKEWMLHKRKYNSKGSHFAYLILIHYYSVPRKLQMEELLNEEIKNGNLLPSHFASLMDFQALNGKGKYYHGGFYNERGKTKDSTKFEQINQRRHAIGLEDFQFRDKKWDRGIRIGKLQRQGCFKHISFFATRFDG